MPAFRCAPPASCIGGRAAIPLGGGVWLAVPPSYDELAHAPPRPDLPRLPRLEAVALDPRSLRCGSSGAACAAVAEGCGRGEGVVLRTQRARKRTAAAAAALGGTDDEGGGWGGGGGGGGFGGDAPGGAVAKQPRGGKRAKTAKAGGGDADATFKAPRGMGGARGGGGFGGGAGGGGDGFAGAAAPGAPRRGKGRPEPWDYPESFEAKVTPPPPVGSSPQQAAWHDIVRRDVPRAAKALLGASRDTRDAARARAEATAKEVRGRAARSVRLHRGGAQRCRKLARDAAQLWKRLEKEVTEARRREQRGVAEAAKREEELRDARRQQQRLNFLLTQTELYSHFMSGKGGAPPGGAPPAQVGGAAAASGDANMADADAGAGAGAAPDEEADEEAAMRAGAAAKAEHAASAARAAVDAFDAEARAAHADAGGGNMLAPSTMPASSDVACPSMFTGELKDYQLRGLQWLVNVYEQGLNCILADESAWAGAAQPRLCLVFVLRF